MTDQPKKYHVPVLVREVISFLAPQPGDLIVDATFGGGSHTRAILEAEPMCRVIACDVDRTALDFNGLFLQEEFPERLELIHTNFSHLVTALKKRGITKVQGILADFGTSQYQIMNKAGFSFASDTPLDMRMSTGHGTLTAADILRRASEQELTHIFFTYGEESRSRHIAKAIVEYRKEHGALRTTGELVALIKKIVPYTKHGIHPATKIFQALRIVVNDELNSISSLLAQSRTLLASEGRLVCISFHSLEDRIVKNFFKEHSSEFETLSSRVVVAQDDELSANPSSRSAKLRAARRLP